MKFHKKIAFTLAEVLITLGIIGVVAALTIPALIHNHQKKVLESQFKKSVSTVSQFIQRAKFDSGIEKFGAFCAEYDGSEYFNKNECYKYLNKVSFGIDSNNRYETIKRDQAIIKTYNSKNTIISNSLGIYSYGIIYTANLPDGSYLCYNINELELGIIIDTNGAKGPNKYGHDIFYFRLDKNKDIVTARMPGKAYTDEELETMYPSDSSFSDTMAKNRIGYPCNLTSTQKGNGIGCAYYALMDECPYDSTKRYFECLPR